MKNMSTVTEDWITVTKAAERMKCSSRTVLRLAEQGKIRRVEVNPRLYLVNVEDVDREKGQLPPTGRPRGS